LSAAPARQVTAIINKDGKRSVKGIASGLYRRRARLKNGTLYIAELSKSPRSTRSRQSDNPPKPTVINDISQGRSARLEVHCHGPDNKLYVEVGQPATTCCTTMRTAKSADN